MGLNPRNHAGSLRLCELRHVNYMTVTLHPVRSTGCSGAEHSETLYYT